MFFFVPDPTFDGGKCGSRLEVESAGAEKGPSPPLGELSISPLPKKAVRDICPAISPSRDKRRLFPRRTLCSKQPPKMSYPPKSATPEISRFYWQCLQLELAPEFPSGELLRDEEAQEAIYERLFAGHATALPPPRYRLRILKELVARIESSILDWDKHVSIY